MVEAIRSAETALGEVRFVPEDHEAGSLAFLKEGEIFTQANIPIGTPLTWELVDRTTTR